MPAVLTIVPTDTSSLTPSADAEALAACVRAIALTGDRQAFATLFKHFAPRVKSFLLRGGAVEAAADELTQETMVTVWRKAALFDAGRAQVSTWIFTIARNLRIDAARRAAVAPEVELDDEGASAYDTVPDDLPALDEALHQSRSQGRLHEAIARLPADQAHVLRLSFFDEHPHAQIAKELNIPLGTVKSRVRLAMTQLRKLMGSTE